ncbi:hypothetical protein EUTSA_v10002220mg, partial [Eutrema salsugineum]
ADGENQSGSAKEIDWLLWKGGSKNNPGYECLRAELRRMAPPNGRAVLGGEAGVIKTQSAVVCLFLHCL